MAKRSSPSRQGKNSRSQKNCGSKSNDQYRGKTGRYGNHKVAETEYSKKRWEEGNNDPSWYTRNSQLTADAGRFSFNWPAGLPFLFGSTNTKVSVPGIIGFRTMNTVGVSTNKESPINIAAQNLYSWVRHANSGHANYDPADLMMYLVAVDSVYSYYAWMARIYGTMRLYSQQNRYYPNALLLAQGVNYPDIQANIADFRYYINQFAVKASSLCVPNVMTYYSRHIWLYSNYFVDSPIAKAKLYVYSPDRFYVFDEANAKLVPASVATNPDVNITYQDIVAFGNTLLNALLRSEDIGIISGDILKAYGEGALIRLNALADEYTVTPLYSAEILEQIQNTFICPGNPVYEDFEIVQDRSETSLAGAILSNPAMRSSLAVNTAGKRLISATDDNPDPTRVLTQTRFAYTTIVDLEDAGKYTFDAVGSEVVVGADVFYFTASGSVAWQRFSSVIPNSDIGRLANVCSFKFHPAIALYNSNNDRIAYFDSNYNYAVMDAHDLAKLHEVCLLSMFAIPYWGSST